MTSLLGSAQNNTKIQTGTLLFGSFCGKHIGERLKDLTDENAITMQMTGAHLHEYSHTCTSPPSLQIALLSPSMASCDYTMNTLRYADR